MLKYLFLNIFSFFLLAIAIVFFLMPTEVFIMVVKYLFVVVFLFGAVSMFVSYKRKLRMVKVLLRRNEDGFNKDSFEPYMEYFCTQLVVILVLKKIGRLNEFPALFKEDWKKTTKHDK